MEDKVICLWEKCENEMVQELYPFCSLECKELWADRHYGEVGKPKQVKSIKFMQERLLEMAAEQKAKKQKRI